MRNWLILPLLVLLASCSHSFVSELPAPSTPSDLTQDVTQSDPFPSTLIHSNSTQSSKPPGIRVGEMSRSQLGSIGCGMALWRSGESGSDRFLLFNGLQSDAMKMLIDGKIMQFERIQSSGQSFYGQTTSQIFRSQDGTTTVQVRLSLGAVGEIESVAVKEGFIRVIKGDKEISIPVVGDAGC